LFDEYAVRGLLSYLARQLRIWGVRLADVQYCPHHPAGSVPAYAITCECRKPRPGMLRVTAQTQHISLSDSWVIGDILDDVEAGNRAGCRSILVDRGNETEWNEGAYRTPHFSAQDLAQAANYILESERFA
jgi:HAD superfamily hydrolase (TIGR01662 family)